MGSRVHIFIELNIIYFGFSLRFMIHVFTCFKVLTKLQSPS